MVGRLMNRLSPRLAVFCHCTIYKTIILHFMQWRIYGQITTVSFGPKPLHHFASRNRNLFVS